MDDGMASCAIPAGPLLAVMDAANVRTLVILTGPPPAPSWTG